MALCLAVTVAHAQSASYARQTWDTESGLPQNSVHAIAQTPDGYMWFGTEGGLARFNSIRFVVFNTRNTPALRSNDIRSLLVNGNELWIATADGVTLLTENKFSSYTRSEGLPGNNVTLVYRNPRQEVCAETADGSACFRNGRFEADGQVVQPPAKADPTFTDREGNRWVGSEASGVTIFRAVKFLTFASGADQLDDVVRCVFRDRQNSVWMGTNSQGLVRYRDGKFTHLTADDGLASNVIVSLGENAAGDLYVGTPDGLNRIHDGSISVITSFDGLPDDFIRSIHSDARGATWVGTRRGISRLHDGHFQNFTHADGLGSDLAGSMVSDSEGALWIATLHGLTKMSGAKFKNFTTKEGLSSDVITALYRDDAGAIWVGTQGGGLNRFFNGSFQHFPATAGLPDIIYGISEDGSHNLWLASDSGIYRVNRLSLERDGAHTEVVSYGTSDGLRVSECSGGGHPAVAKLADGSIWFATLKGAAVTQAEDGLTRVAPPVTVESVSLDDGVYRPAEVTDVRPGYSRIAFTYAALSFAAPQKVLFRYKLEGFDKDFVNAGSARTAYYTNLAPGPYRFLVSARNGDGIWSDKPASIAFRLEPRFYQTWWFAVLVVAALLLAGYGVYRWRVAQVEAQFKAVLQERNRIAREIHDTLAQGFAGISIQLEMVSRKLSATAESAREHLDQARMLVRSSLAEARRSIWELRSQSDEVEDLAARLTKMASYMGGAVPGKIKLQVRGTYRPLGPRLEDELLRIAQEAVANALRHAQASRIDIELAFEQKLLHMSVTDDGQGFAPGVTPGGMNGHFGLQGMRERAAEIGAGLEVQTAPGQGTRISIEAPIG